MVDAVETGMSGKLIHHSENRYSLLEAPSLAAANIQSFLH
jgi:triosephosphate isomerase